MLNFASHAFCIKNTLVNENYINIDPKNIPNEILAKIENL